MLQSISRFSTSVLVLLAVHSDALAQDWPQWRGPERTGVLSDWKGPSIWPNTLTLVWNVTIGEGHSSPVVVGDKVYVHSRTNDREVVRALDLKTGKPLWKQENKAPYKMHPAATGHGKGPKSTPVVTNGKLITYGISGVLSCFDVSDGKLLWQRSFADKFPKTSPLYGVSMSPIAYRDSVIVQVGGHDKGTLAAFYLETGDIKWTSGTDGPSYASPVLTTLHKTEQIITMTQQAVVGVLPADGRELWRIPFKTGFDQNAITPVIDNDRIIFSGYKERAVAYNFTTSGLKWTTQRKWSNASIPMYLSSPVVVDRELFGMSQSQKGQLFCADPATGTVFWTSPGRFGDNAVLIAAGKHLLVQTTGGELLVVARTRQAFRVVKKYQLSTQPTWAHPALVGNLLLVKDFDKLTCWKLFD